MHRRVATLFVLSLALWSTSIGQAGPVEEVVVRMCDAYRAEAALHGPKDREMLDALVARRRANAGQNAEDVAVFVEGSFAGLANAHMGLLFKITDKGADLVSIYHARNNYQFLRWLMGARPLWQVEYLNAGEWAETLDSTKSACVTSRLWTDPGGGHIEIVWVLEAQKLAVNMRVDLPESSSLSYWSLAVENRRGDIGIGKIAFPMVRGMGVSDATMGDSLAIPQKSGWLYHDPGHTADFHGPPAMQYCCYYTTVGSGLYLDTVDGQGITKELAGLADSGTVATWFEYTVADAGVPGHNYQMRSRVGVFDGDWYDASQIYRQWALKQKWAPKTKFHERTDIPTWFRQNGITVRAEGDPAEVLAQGNQWRSTYSLPATFNWYSWADTPNLTANCPDVVCRPHFKETVAELNQRGLRVVAYSMFRLWDTSLSNWKKDGGEYAGQRDECGELIWGRYDGNPLAYACPASKVWRKKYIDAVVRLVRDYGIKGIYADLAGTRVAETCYNPAHGHPVGGGGWFADAEAEMLTQVREAARAIDPEFVILVEANDERVIGAYDGYLIYQGADFRKVTSIPMFQAVYGDYVKSYGAKSCGEQAGLAQNVNPAQVLVWGGQIGRVGASLVQKPQTKRKADSLVGYARLRQAAEAYLGRGTMQRPLMLTVKGAEELDPIDAALSVEQATYRAPDGSLGFVFASTRSRDHRTISFEIRPEAYGIPSDGRWTLYWLDNSGALTPAQTIEGNVTLSATFAPREAKVLVAKVAQEIN